MEFSAPSTDWLGALFVGNTAPCRCANVFTNPLGDRLDAGNRLGMPGEAGHHWLQGQHARHRPVQTVRAPG